MRVADKWQQFEVISTSNGKKLERWGTFLLSRPDPQIIWTSPHNTKWKLADAEYSRSSTGGGAWKFKRDIPESWNISYNSLKFKVSPTGFKHTGLFPEQSVNWEFMADKIKKSARKLRVLNLFAYTGGATLACANVGAEVCHVDAAKSMVKWAKENAELSGLSTAPIRWIVDDCRTFVQREIRRGSLYDAVIMDPPSYGRGPSGEVWHLEDSIFSLVELVTNVLTKNPEFFIINSYTTGLSPSVTENILALTVGKKYFGKLSSSDIGLPVSDTGIFLPCGSTAIWERV